MINFLKTQKAKDKEFAKFCGIPIHHVLPEFPFWISRNNQIASEEHVPIDLKHNPVQTTTKPIEITAEPTQQAFKTNDPELLLLNNLKIDDLVLSERTTHVSEVNETVTGKRSPDGVEFTSTQNTSMRKKRKQNAQSQPNQTPVIKINRNKNIHPNMANAMISFIKTEMGKILDRVDLPRESPYRLALEELIHALPTEKNSMTGLKTFHKLVGDLKSHRGYPIAEIFLNLCNLFLDNHAKAWFLKSTKLEKDHLDQQLEGIHRWKIEVSDALLQLKIEEEYPRSPYLKDFIEIILSFF